MTREYATLKVTVADHLGEVVLHRPDKGNAMSYQMFEEIGRAIGELDNNPEIRSILLYGEGKAFSYGLDLQDAMVHLGPLITGGGLAGPRLKLKGLIHKWQREVGAPYHSHTPVVVAIHGWCIGGALELVSACDIRLCSEDAKFSLREAKLGIVADLGGLQRLPKIIGDGATRELALTAKDIDASRALQLGLVSQIHRDRETLLEKARKEARSIAALSPLVTKGIKEVLNHGDGKSISEGLEYVSVWNSAFLQSEDFGEAMASFFEKREPQYKGE